MLKLADLVDQNKELLATIETWDNGSFPARPPGTVHHPAKAQGR